MASGSSLAQDELWVDSVATSSGSRAAPSAATEGMDLYRVVGFRVFVSAASGQTLSGAGSMLAWVWEPQLNRWCRNTGLDFTVTASSVRTAASPDFETKVPRGRVVFQASGITTSSGEVTTHIRPEYA